MSRAAIADGSMLAVEYECSLVSATHVSLRRAVEADEFREDLMYRIRVVPLFFPPLRDRYGDIGLLIWHFIDEFADESDRTIEALSGDAMEAMLTYEWPGNVRELRNVIRCALIVGSGEVIECADLTPEFRGESCDPSRAEIEEPMTECELERHRLIEALDEASGKKQKAAELLDMSRTTLWRKLKEHGISGS